MNKENPCEQNCEADIQEIISLLCSNPELGYKKLVSLDYPTSPVYKNPEFWLKFTELRISNEEIKRRVEILKALFESRNYFWAKYQDEKLKFQHLRAEDRIKLLFQIYSIELGKKLNPDISTIDKISFITEAINEIISMPYSMNEKEIDLDPATPYYYYNSILFEELADAFVFGGFELYQEDHTFLLKPKDERVWSLQICEILKREILFSSYSNKHSTDVSELQHFKTVDPELETDKGFCHLLVENATVTSNHEGVFGKTVENIEDPRNFEFIYRQWFSYNYRQELEGCFEPKHTTLIQSVNIRKENVEVNLFELFSFLAGIIAYFRAMTQFIMPEVIVFHFKISDLLDSLKKLGFSDEITNDKAKELLHFLVSTNKCPGLTCYNDIFYFSPKIFQYYPIVNTIFQQYFSTIFYKQFKIVEDKNGRPKKLMEHKNREKDVVSSLTSFFESPRFKAFSNIDLKINGVDDGEIDLIVASPEEKILLVCELKNENSATHRWVNKARWFKKHISKGREQHLKDEKFINSKIGKKFFSNNGIEYSGSWETFHLLVSDNMLADHEMFIFNDETKKRFRKISIFELECLMTDLEIFKEGTRKWVEYQIHHIKRYKPEVKIPNQIESYLSETNNHNLESEFIEFINSNRVIPEKLSSLTQLLKTINSNLFWDIPNKQIDGINYELTTAQCHPEYRLTV